MHVGHDDRAYEALDLRNVAWRRLLGGRHIKLEHYHNVGGSSATAQSRLAGMIKCALLAQIRDTLRRWR